MKISREKCLSRRTFPQCVRMVDAGVVRALAMVEAVQKLNAAPLMTQANVTLGLWIKDSCSDVGTALRATQEFTREQTSCASNASAASNQDRLRKGPIMALIGASFSELSIAIARQLTLRMIPQYQTGAMVQLLLAFRWNWVGIITTDGDYGQSALDYFLSETSDNQICVAFKSVLPGLTANHKIHAAIRQTALNIHNNPKAKVIVSFAKPTLMKDIFSELRRLTLATGHSLASMRRVWIASDSWSAMRVENVHETGPVVGFHFKSGNAEQFREEESGESEEETESSLELRKFYSMLNTEKDAVKKRVSPEFYQKAVFSVEMAVVAVAHAAVKLCRYHDCKSPGAVQPWQLLKSLWMEEFEFGGQSYRFDQRGDINLGYDVSVLRVRAGRSVLETVAEYHTQNSSFTFSRPGSSNPLMALKNIVSRCSNSCAPGQFKKSAEGQHTCCYDCINCTENYYSNSTDMDQCLSCDTNSEWAPEGSKACIPKQMLFFSWHNGFAIVLLAFSALGIVLTLLMSGLFFHQRQTPVVRAAGGPLSQVILFSLVASFVSALLFVGQPNSYQCKTRQVLFGISFTICVACILVKTLKILLAFQVNPMLQSALRKLNRPYVIVSVCVALQAATCVCWLVLKSPSVYVVNQSTTLLQDCHEGSYIAFGVMLGYIALLAFVCFVCAFKCRKLPQQYNEARFITFSMLLYLISWLLFIPIYVTTSGVYLPAVEMVVILISNYGILSCHFFPKCYVMLFKKDKNTQSAFRKTLYEYTSKSTASFSSSGSSGYNDEKDSTSVDSKNVHICVLNQDVRPRGHRRSASM
ncbi:hypothetical protein WMY93_026255 [Mugilogobius chulae]|uniref:G-protein coupled receptor family C group 6 member A n=1 Tax=Mugilogobius chulae TaxID=88201 RepID=A0AAW0MXX1_9GOBI